MDQRKLKKKRSAIGVKKMQEVEDSNNN